MNDVATALTDSLTKTGQTVPTANIPLGGFKITNLGNGSAATDAASIGQTVNALAASSGSSLVGAIGTSTGEVATNVSAYLNLNVKGLKRSFGCVGDGTTDDYAKIVTAIASGKIIEAEDLTFAHSSPIVINTNYTRLYGYGIGKTIFKNTGAGNGFEVKSAGGVDTTKIGIDLRDFTIDGNSSGQDNLYAYDISHLILRNIEAKSALRWGLNMEMCVSPKIYDSKFNSNLRGARIGAALKNSVEFLTNEANFYGCLFNSNTQEGISLNRTILTKFFGGDCSSNANGILMLGARRCRIRDMWIENNTTDAINTATSASPTALNCDNNEFDIMQAGTGNVTINNGTQNVIDGYVAANIVIANGAATPNTTLMPGLNLVGTLTDTGSATRDLRPTSSYIKVSTSKRYQRTVGTTVDYTSDIPAFRFAQLMSLSATAVVGSNLCGFVDIANAATTSAVAFSVNEPDSSYGVWLSTWDASGTPVADSHIAWITLRAVSGFTINLKTAPVATSTVRVFWMLVKM